MTQEAQQISLDDYLALDQGEVKHEYVEGVAYAMAGGTLEHAAIAGNVVRYVGTALRERPCQIFPSDARLAVEATGLRTYPDASVVCGEILRTDRGLSMLNPIVLVEVTSPSSADWDRGGKFAHYRRIPSLREYLVIAHETPVVEHHVRGDGGIWMLRDVREGSVELASIGVTLPLEEIYLKVALPAPALRA